ncbi:hypothetical protein A5886_001428 [Enterococcus sp. 8G7_MSG3316]|uniref:PTS EIIB type-4 domain-containing protein n=1 Tax=Candidatus Enterococcus testudinis TaxID=1834191 RepID=A0A242A6J1_9ENTE|nr:PTS sugar transporter subunit IIB [Enterococcus sp. 8G7_MSG3316]OTN76351.1 hypothetical protein A5886_001428 [Enterococcus sp. 8G7_MSG3316]
MAIELVRIDDRLIHGQVVTTWVKQKRIEQILIINDDIVNDPVQKSVFDMMAPQDVLVKTFSIHKFIEVYHKTTIKRRTLILLTNSVDALALCQGGVDFNTLNLGGMKNKPGRKQYTKAVSLNEEELKALKMINETGVKVEIQMIPSEKILTLNDLERNEK